MSAVDVRNRFVELVKKDLVGPIWDEWETIERRSPKDLYTAGILYPKNTIVDDEGSEEDFSNGEEDGAEEGSKQDEVRKRFLAFPSSIGLSFNIAKSVHALEINLDWGLYTKSKKPDPNPKEDSKDKEIDVYTRIPVNRKVKLEIQNGKSEYDLGDKEIHTQAKLIMVVRENPNVEFYTVSLYFQNTYPAEKQKIQIQYYIFQPKMSVTPQGDDHGILSWDHESEIAGDPLYKMEKKKFDMLYRKNREFAVGHNCSAVWDERNVDYKNFKKVAKIQTDIFPMFEVPNTETTNLDTVPLDMKFLARGDRKEIIQNLKNLPTDYRTWMESQQKRLNTINEQLAYYEEEAKASFAEWDTACKRIDEGIKVLESDDSAWQAFQFANEAVYLSRLRASVANDYKSSGVRNEESHFDVVNNRSWRMFQLGFLLLNIPSMVDPSHPDRSGDGLRPYCDLIWFPTGGGKTEAYLALTAFTLGMRRLNREDNGVSVIMRYTLRLLTLQQFERASGLICASEAIRRKDESKWGKVPFRIGLWVGQNTTPNDFEASKQNIQNIKLNRHQGASAVQLTHCPWCGEELRADFYEADEEAERTILYCSDDTGKCDFSKKKSNKEGLPLVAVDSEIYRFLPSLLISTVDKYAQMAWNGKVAKIFGKVGKYNSKIGYLCPDDAEYSQTTRKKEKNIEVGELAPPDLIIQDELHLISGPLGSITGIYETAIDTLCTRTVNGKRIRPKIVASSATVKLARSQVESLFQRDVKIFPPSGLDASDNFFSEQVEPKPNDPNTFGRLYVGVCASGIRMKALLIRIGSAILASAQKIREEFGEDAADPYWTMVGYFNSLRELGGMRRLLDDDISSRLSKAGERNLSTRSIRNGIEELTSRISQKNIRGLLTRLDVNLKKEAKGKNPQRAIDVLLATNMISVGVDIPRLGVMMVAGQPKYTSEYIQASSRVGRSKPGVVFTVYNWARPRDLSHYERFMGYHSSFYKHVEANSVTPFSKGARDKGLTGTVFSILRSKFQEHNANESVRDILNHKSNLDEVLEIMLDRAKSVLGEEHKDYSDSLKNQWSSMKEKWYQKLEATPNIVYKKLPNGKNAGFLESPEEAGGSNSFTALNSLREVEQSALLLIEDEKIANVLSINKNNQEVNL
jgi:hypothetical protein